MYKGVNVSTLKINSEADKTKNSLQKGCQCWSIALWEKF